MTDVLSKSDMSHQFDLSDTECPRCGGSLNGLSCEVCSATFDIVLGIPFLGKYEKTDILGLIEIAANSENRHMLALPETYVNDTERLCESYHLAEDKDEFIKSNPDAAAWWFQNRYEEFKSFHALMGGIDLRGKKVLDIGAGQGYDSQRLHLLGAEVTALEFSPIVAEAARSALPHLRWIGGFGHALPFKNASFDAVFCNAALHHMRDVPATIAEALRVLRPGGTFISTGDPFRGSHLTEQHEFQVFDRHEAVLLGINEQIPKFSDFVEVLKANANILRIELFTNILYGGITGYLPDVVELTRWMLGLHGEKLGARNGSLAMKVTLLEPWPHERRYQKDGVLSPSQFADWLHNQSLAVSELVAFVDPSQLNRNFPGPQTKIDLINGWRLDTENAPYRTAYRRARWFLKRQIANCVEFEAKSPAPSSFEIFLNATLAKTVEVGATWTRVSIDLSDIKRDAAYVLEIRRTDDAGDFDANCFQVQRRKTRFSFASAVKKWRQAA